MPTYEYCCGKCGKDYEVITRVEFRDAPVSCPECGLFLSRVYRTAPAVFCPGCPSYEFKRQGSEESVRQATDRKFDERNRDEINYAAKHVWKPVPEAQLAKEAEHNASIGLGPLQHAKLKVVGD